MSVGQEIELKLRMNRSEEIAALVQDPALETFSVEPWQKDMLLSTYYDTPDKALLKSRLTFRVRKAGVAYEATVKGGGKSSGGLHERQEWNVDLTAPEASVGAFQNTVIYPLLTTTVKEASLEPLFTTEFLRHRLLLRYGDSLIEAAVDQGTIVGKEKTDELAELELELKEGDASDLLALGALLAKTYSLQLEKRSKFQRGLTAAGLPVTESKVTGEDTLSLLLSFAEAEAAFCASGGSRLAAETVFQLWDKFIWRFLKKIGASPLKASALDQLDQITQLYQPLREVFFLAEQMRRLAQEGKITAAYHKELATAFRQHKQKTRQKLLDYLAQGKTTAIILALWSFLKQEQTHS
ncbi:MAG: CYTH domain-containing protein [Sporomusaceae bacterium]|nr:CYTH domain-containing protein [Sporomusaceae bacterium]